MASEIKILMNYQEHNYVNCIVNKLRHLASSSHKACRLQFTSLALRNISCVEFDLLETCIIYPNDE